ncbi:MAG: SAM-dependent chlorinase/fluorinase [Dehalococcoidia bacterium]|nr:SAM-dependent chlorinase/fluorinase [Dehalococcoidia bacterium]
MAMVTSPIITLTTDFGTQDPYVGVMKGVIHSINRHSSIIDISHDVQPQSILEGAFIIGSSHRFFPKGTLHVAVVDPGVGTSRSALLLVTPAAYFLGPDNGIFSYIVKEGFRGDPEMSSGYQVRVPNGYRAYRLTNPEFWMHPVSSTFHGRDVFAPVAAHLSLGVPEDRLGEEIHLLTYLPVTQPQWKGDTLTGRVVHVDRFGNLITDIPAFLLSGGHAITIVIKEHCIAGISRSYAEGERLLAIIGSNNTLELSVRNGSAAHSLGAGVEEEVRIRKPGT